MLGITVTVYTGEKLQQIKIPEARGTSLKEGYLSILNENSRVIYGFAPTFWVSYTVHREPTEDES